jgi:hypothetical protein
MLEDRTLVKIFTGSEVFAIKLVSLLDEKNITSSVRNQMQTSAIAGFSAGTPTTIQVFIYGEDQEKAQPIIEEFKNETDF